MAGMLASNFSKALTCQIRVIGALILREMRVRFGRSQLGYLWAVAEPLGYVTVLTVVFRFVDRHPAFGSSIPLFFCSGILPFHLFRHISTQLTGAFSANQALLTYPIVQRIDTVIARTFLEIATSLFVMLVVFGTLINVENVPMPNDPIRILEAILLLSLLGFGYGLLSAVLATRFGSWQNIVRLLGTPLLFLSGVFYSIESLPAKARAIVTWNPIIHGVEMFRDGYYSNYRGNEIDAGYLAFCGIVLTFIALAMERTVRGRIE